MQVKVSIIIPVYNVEKYLEKCLDSVVKQTFRDYEVIVVNDGSTDKSNDIIDSFVTEHPNIVHSYEKTNGGLGSARNYGLKYAKGEYILFLDSDDWIDEKAIEVLYNKAVNDKSDLVIFDFTSIYSGWATGWRSEGYRGGNVNPNKIDFLLNSTNPATACNKFFKRDLFDVFKFNEGWYEDIATTPVLMSYANNITYLPIQLYYYRQHSDSIIHKENDPRTLHVIDAWERIISNAKSEYRNEIECAVYLSIIEFISFKPEYYEVFVDYATKKKETFVLNKYIKGYIAKGTLDIYKAEFIPKVIHYFWFGGGEKSELIKRCMRSWERYAPGFKIVEWNESNCDVNECRYVKEAYENKKWAFVADYFRCKVIYEHGGIYVDTDMEFTSNISSLCLHNLFFPFETKNDVNSCIFGATPKNSIVQKLYYSYLSDRFIKKDGTFNTSYTIVKRLTDLLRKHTNIEFNGQSQLLKGNIKLYGPNELILDMYDGKNMTQHHYDASWWDVKEGSTSYKYEILKNYFVDRPEYSNQDVNTIHMLQYQLDEMKKSTCWRITKPLRTIKNLIVYHKKY